MLLLPVTALARQIYIKIIQTKQNHVIKLIFFATLSGKNTDSALTLLNISEMLTVANVCECECECEHYVYPRIVE